MTDRQDMLIALLAPHALLIKHAFLRRALSISCMHFEKDFTPHDDVTEIEPKGDVSCVTSNPLSNTTWTLLRQ